MSSREENLGFLLGFVAIAGSVANPFLAWFALVWVLLWPLECLYRAGHPE